MIRLSIPKEPYWLDLSHGVRVRVRPLSTAVYEAARAKAARQSRAILADHAEIAAVGGDVSGLPDMADVDAVAGLSQLLFAQGLAVAAILEWTGVLDGDTDLPVPVTEKSVCDLMMVHRMAEDFVVQYTRTHEQLVAEGNGSRPAPNGTSAAGRDTATGAANREAPAPTGVPD